MMSFLATLVIFGFGLGATFFITKEMGATTIPRKSSQEKLRILIGFLCFVAMATLSYPAQVAIHDESIKSAVLFLFTIPGPLALYWGVSIMLGLRVKHGRDPREMSKWEAAGVGYDDLTPWHLEKHD